MSKADKPFEVNSNSSLSDQLASMAINQMSGGSGSKEMLGIMLQKMQQENDYLRHQLDTRENELRDLRSENMNLKIAAGQYEAQKTSDIAIAVQQAKLEQQKADEEVMKQLMEEEKKNAKGGLSGLFSDPNTIGTILQHAPTAIAALKDLWNSAKPASAVQPEAPQYAYGPNGEPLRSIAQLPH